MIHRSKRDARSAIDRSSPWRGGGARNWSILRDLEDPDRWVESYHFPTWTDYVRHAERRTVADDEVIGRLHELHRGARPLKVHRMIERQTVHAEDDTPRIDPEPDHMP